MPKQVGEASMTQNIYDDETFFAGYSQLPRSVHGLDGAPEWPVLRGLLPTLEGKRVLDLGCGFGWFCRFAASEGAAGVLGVDVSEKMLERARRETGDPRLAYERADLEAYAPPADAFDLAYSSLAFHYVEDLAGLLARVHAALKPGGSLVCSVEHPIMTAPGRSTAITTRAGGSATGWRRAWSSVTARSEPISICCWVPASGWTGWSNGRRARSRSQTSRAGRGSVNGRSSCSSRRAALETGGLKGSWLTASGDVRRLR
jgi:SAM-dependent methyltransferase